MDSLKIRILLADDRAVVPCGLRMVSEPVHLAILDVRMPRMTGLQPAREPAQRRPEPRTLILSMHDNDEYLFEALRARASGYVLDSSSHR